MHFLECIYVHVDASLFLYTNVLISKNDPCLLSALKKLGSGSGRNTKMSPGTDATRSIYWSN
jgi:23S rRNA A1618 N6-methylase RlmF